MLFRSRNVPASTIADSELASAACSVASAASPGLPGAAWSSTAGSAARAVRITSSIAGGTSALTALGDGAGDSTAALIAALTVVAGLVVVTTENGHPFLGQLVANELLGNRDDLGNLWIAFHGEVSYESRERCAGIRRVHFDVDGRPRFNLSANRDVNLALRNVSIHVTVK